MATGRQDIQQMQRRTWANNIFRKRQVFNDPIHGHIELHPVCVRIIDTPQFQRLRHIKQLDACYLVYPGASHNRFEHSLGTCFLAGKLLRTIMERQPDEEITQRDILCVEIAGLCHDLGQGPFSHVFEKRFMPSMGKQFTHEETARKMFEYILEDNNGEVKNDIQKIIRDCQIPDFEEFTDEDFLFIKEMIDLPNDLEHGEWPYHGRDETKSFMYEIVANKRNGIDVDKWDYLARDSYMLGMKVNFDYNKCFNSARVLTGNGLHDLNGTNGAERHDTVPRKQICYREKDAQDLYDMFYTRITLHRRAYQHKTHKVIGMMICNALKDANDTVKFVGKDGIKYSIADAVDDMKAYTLLTDDVFQVILHSPTSPDVLQSVDTARASTDVSQASDSDIHDIHAGPSDIERKRREFNNAKKILTDILNRKLLKFVTQTQIKDGQLDETKFKEEFLTCLMVQENTIVDYDVVELDYGMKNKDPMEKVLFYKKENDETPINIKRNQVSYVLPDTFAENILRIYYKVTSPDAEEGPLVTRIKEEFKKWCNDNGLPAPRV